VQEGGGLELAGRRELEDHVGRDLEAGGGDLLVWAAPGEGGGPLLLLDGRPRLVVKDGDQAPPPAAGAQGERGPHEPAPAHAEPTPAQLEALVARPLEALQLEGELGQRVCRCGRRRHASHPC
jgi:hypothetical protein